MGFQSKIFVDHHCVLIDFDITLDCEECIFQTIEYRTDKNIREKHIQSHISIISHHQCSLQT
jgi:hypothetical protein